MKSDILTDNRKRLLGGAEVRQLRQYLLGFALCYAGLLVLSCLTEHRELVFPMLAIYISLIFLPILGFLLWRLFRIFRSAEEYVFCTARLAQPHTGFPRDFMYFTVVLETQEEGTFVANTHSVFHTRQGPLSLEDYVNKTVTIAWNRETDMVVVIG